MKVYYINYHTGEALHYDPRWCSSLVSSQPRHHLHRLLHHLPHHNRRRRHHHRQRRRLSPKPPGLDVFAALPNRLPVARWKGVSALLPRTALGAAYPFPTNGNTMDSTWKLPESPTPTPPTAPTPPNTTNEIRLGGTLNNSGAPLDIVNQQDPVTPANSGAAGAANGQDGMFNPFQVQGANADGGNQTLTPGFGQWWRDRRVPWIGDQNPPPPPAVPSPLDGDRDPRERMPDVLPYPGPNARLQNNWRRVSPAVPAMDDESGTDNNVARSLWFRTQTSDTNFYGEETNISVRRDRNPMLYSHSFTVGGGSDNRGNQNHAPVRILLPDTVCVNPTTGQVDAYCETATYAFGTTTAGSLANLNLPFNPMYPSDNNSGTGQSGTRPASAFSVCRSNNQGSLRYHMEGSADYNTQGCNTQLPVITQFRTSLVTATSNGFTLSPTSGTAPQLGTDGQDLLVTYTAQNTYADNRINYINLDALPNPLPDMTLPANANNATRLVLRENRDAQGNRRGPSPVFVIRKTGGLTLRQFRMQLDGVDPNNVFWLVDGNLTIDGTLQDPSVVMGNLIGNGGTLTVPQPTIELTDVTLTAHRPSVVSLRSVRLLNFNTVINDNNMILAAITTTDQPVLLPVLQVNNPGGNNTNTDEFQQSGTLGGTPSGTSGQWQERASRVESPLDNPQINIYFVAGASPSRSGIPYRTSVTSTSEPQTGFGANANVNTTGGSEAGGGLGNFVRFLGNWSGLTPRIFGGFIQTGRSSYASAPLSATAPFNAGAATPPPPAVAVAVDMQTLFVNPAAPLGNQPFTSNRNNRYNRFSGYNKAYQNNANLPFYTRPGRAYGFDVGLLTQQPDLFAQRFTEALPSPNEFFRETNRDDRWTKALLCSLAPASPTTNNTVADGVNVGKPRLVGTRPTNYTVPALAGGDRPRIATRLGCPHPFFTTRKPGDEVLYSPQLGGTL
ncbi:MAG: hypothetical protein HC918_00395 [Oscillatoriales cyanobacterium SM2_1_8]|nr:hypothetical protein [Oscillatoriales cyanobacterium SM2_1_8]